MKDCLKDVKITVYSKPGRAVCAVILLLAIFPLELFGSQEGYLQHNLVADLPGVADFTDANLVNPWGIAFSATSPFWISANHSGLSTLYNSSGAPQSLVVNIPPPTNGVPPAAPTGIVFNGSTGFTVVPGAPARFIFSTEDGTIVGWNNGTNAVVKVDNSGSGAVYKGLAIGTTAGAAHLYATDFHNNRIDVFDTNFAAVTLQGSFADSSIPAGYAPFNIQQMSGLLYVTYAQQDADAHDDTAGPGHGFVNAFDLNGNLLKRVVSAGVLNSPWGLALAPAGFGVFAGALLVGNFGDGAINAFDPGTGAYLGAMSDTNGTPLFLNGLWALAFGNGGNGGDPHTLYFTAGPNGEANGLFGSLLPASPTFTGIVDKGLAASVSWAGGVGRFLVQKKVSLADSNWLDVLTTQNRSTFMAKDTPNCFLRVQSESTRTILPFTVLLSGAAENPPIATTGTGIGNLSIEGTNLTYQISFADLSAPAIAAHIHTGADATNNGAVAIPFTVPSATSGAISGTASLTLNQLSDVLNGRAYVNIHTSAHAGGEVRGQIVPLHVPMNLNGPSEVPPVATAATATGSLTLVGSQMYYDISYSGLKGTATAAHIHGPADPTVPAPVLIPLNNPTGTSGNISGSVSLDPTQMVYLLSGLTYINIHTVSNLTGEIRGQIYPLQLRATMNGANEISPTASKGSGSGFFTVVTNALTYNIVFTNLLSPAVAAHIHGPGTASQNAPVLIPFSAPSATAGTISGTANLTPTELLDLFSSLTYANIHTTNYAGGEIRGQVLPQN